MKKLLFIILFFVFGIASFCFALEVEREFYSNGALKHEVFHEGAEITLGKSFYPTGEIESVSASLGGGIMKQFSYSPEGVIESKHFDNGVGKPMEMQLFNENGILKSSSSFVLGEGNIHNKFFDEHGLRIEGEYDQNKEDCNNIYYDENGKVIKDGMSKGFYKNGMLMWEGEIRDGKSNGFSRLFYTNGKLKKESSFKNGRLIGDQKFYSPEGKLICEINYPQEYRNIRMEKTEEDGFLKKVAYFNENDKCYGSIKSYDGQGNLIFHYYCDEAGKPITEIHDNYKDNEENLCLLGSRYDSVDFTLTLVLKASVVKNNSQLETSREE